MSLVLDCSSPGTDPAAFVAAVRSVGATGVAGYLRNWPQWTREMVQAILADGLEFLPIELYDGQAPGDTLAALAAWGITSGAVALDVEAGSWPSDQWQQEWRTAVEGAGFVSVGYSQAQPMQRHWSAVWTWPDNPNQMTVEPIRPVVSGSDATQYAHNCGVGAFNVDASNFGFPLGGDDLTPEQDARLTEIMNYVVAIYQGDPSKADCSTTQLKASVATLQKSVDALGGAVPPADLQPVLDAIAKLQADLDGLTLKKV